MILMKLLKPLKNSNKLMHTPEEFLKIHAQGCGENRWDPGTNAQTEAPPPFKQ